jgi:hypothetical protein
MITWTLRRTIDQVEREWNDGVRHIRNMIDASPRAPRMVVRVAHLPAAVVLVCGFGHAAPAAQVSVQQQPVVSAYTQTPQRIAASTAVVVGLIGAVIGGMALVRSADRVGNSNRRRGAIVALALGPIGLVIGGLVVATAGGGLGTGNGLGGGIVAMMVGLIGTALGGLALARSRRTA